MVKEQFKDYAINTLEKEKELLFKEFAESDNEFFNQILSIKESCEVASEQYSFVICEGGSNG
ncbi:MAG: hypothetical protein IKJ93_04795 [Clostridia bacterium]|nr:hypothetical protein [Clostridia bacterium]